MAENLKTEYQIAIEKIGNGAAQAAAEMEQVKAQADAASASVNKLSAQTATLSTAATKTSTVLQTSSKEAQFAAKSFARISSELTNATSTAFPKFASAMVGINSLMVAGEQVAKRQEYGLSKLTAGVIGVTAAVTAGVAIWDIYKQKQEEAQALMIKSFERRAALEAVMRNAQSYTGAGPALASVNAISEPGRDNRSLPALETLMAQKADRDELARELKRLGMSETKLKEFQKDSASQYSVGLGNIAAGSRDTAEGAFLRGSLGIHEASKAQTQAAFMNQKREVEAYYRFWVEQAQAAGEDTTEIMTQWQVAEGQIFKEAGRAASATYQEMVKFADEAGQQISSSLSSGIVQAFRDGKFEADKFFGDLLASIAQIAIQQALVRAIGSASGGTGLLGSLFAANGGQFPRQFAGGGVASVSAPTYFPNFNVIAGEAGREVLTVLSKPRMMEIGGMAAQVGYAAGQRLAITSADALEQRGGNGGHIQIEVTMHPDVEARVVRNSVAGAQVQVARDLRSTTPISAAAREAVGR